MWCSACAEHVDHKLGERERDRVSRERERDKETHKT